MLKTTTPYLLPLLIALLLLQACVPKQGITNGRKELGTLNQQFKEQDTRLTDLEKERKKKEQLNQIDDTASNRIRKFIEKTHVQLDSLMQTNTVLIGETAMEKADWDRLRKALAFSRKSSKLIGEKIDFLHELIEQNLVLRIDQDVVFAPGKYEVEPSVADAIGRIFEPAAKEIDYLVKKYPDFPLSLVITAKGYSDATQIAEGSALYKQLKERVKLQTSNPGNRELNKELSVARAEAVIRLFKNYTVNRSKSGGNIRNILYLHEGKGEALPDPKVSNYQVNDPRRRVVLLFWSIFPE
jgi:flagellar motor protein MotB